MTLSRRAKRCPGCRRMIPVGSPVVLTDDRRRTDAIDAASRGWSDVRRSYTRGAWHTWHPECHTEHRAQLAALTAEAAERHARDQRELRAFAETLR